MFITMKIFDKLLEEFFFPYSNFITPNSEDCIILDDHNLIAMIVPSKGIFALFAE